MRVEQMEQRPLDGVTGVGMTQLTEGTTAQRVRVDVAGPDDVPVRVGPGWAALWERGEGHTSWADTRMTVLIIQRAGAEA